MSRWHTHVDHRHSQPSGGQRWEVVIDVSDPGVATMYYRAMEAWTVT